MQYSYITLVQQLCMDIGEYFPEYNILLHEFAIAINRFTRAIFSNIRAITIVLYGKAVKLIRT